MPVNIESFAKINLGLEVLGLRPDGYHEIKTIFQTIDFSDRIEIETIPGNRLELNGDDPSIPWNENNLIFKAVMALRMISRMDFGLRIEVTKRVPAGMGLGGGSSNAAAVILAVNNLFSLGLSLVELKKIAAKIGADVSYFLHGGLCLGTGKGEQITELEDFPAKPCLIVFPGFRVSTAEAYASIDAFLTSESKDSKINRFLKNGDLSFLENDLERTVVKSHSEIDELKSLLKAEGAELALMTGSGAAVFGLYREEKGACSAYTKIKDRAESLLTHTLPRKEYWTRFSTGVSPSW